MGSVPLIRRIAGTSRRQRRDRVASLLAFATGSLFLIWASLFAPLEGVQNAFADALFLERQGSPNVVIVVIDESALKRYGRVGDWPRSLHATAVQKLHEAGARVIIYDLLFADEGQEDQVLSQAISEAGNVILPVAGINAAANREDSLLVYENVTLPTDRLRRAAAALAHANVIEDDDGRVRRIPLAIAGDDGQQYRALSVAAVYLQFGHLPPPELPTGSDRLPIFGREVPLEEFQSMRVNYVGSQNSFSRVAFGDLADGRLEQSLVRNKIVLVGLTAPGSDVHPVPLGRLNGVEVQANALDTLLRAQFLSPVSNTTNLVVGLVLVIVVAFTFPRWRIAYAVAFAAALVGAWLIVAVFLFFFGGYIPDYVNAPSALLLATVVALVHRTMAERAAQAEVTELFGRYVSHELARELVNRADRSELELGGELREVTIMFCDIRGFVTLSQQILPADMVQLLNRQFDVIVSNVLKNGGIVHQFLGDSVMAFWSAPKDQPDHAFLACLTAMEAQTELELLPEFGRVVRFGWGVNTGVVLAGNVGTAGRLEYTVVGEAVNRASRLCGAAEGGEIWIGESTYESIRGRLDAEELPPQRLKGMAEPITVYRLKRPASRRQAKEEST